MKESNERFIYINSKFLNIHSIPFIRFVQIAVASFGSEPTCATSPGGFSRLTYDVLQWIRTVKVCLGLFSPKKISAYLRLKVDSWQHKVNREMSEQQSRIEDMSHTGSWCAFQDEWSASADVIAYDKILHSDSNMNRNALHTGNGEI